MVLWIFMTVFCYCSLIVPWLSSLLSPYSRFTLPLRSCFPFRRPNHSLPRPPVAKNLKCLLFSSVYLSACVYFLPICLSLSVCLSACLRLSLCVSVCLSFVCLSVFLSVSVSLRLNQSLSPSLSLPLSSGLTDQSSLRAFFHIPLFPFFLSVSLCLSVSVCLSLETHKSTKRHEKNKAVR